MKNNKISARSLYRDSRHIGLHFFHSEYTEYKVKNEILICECGKKYIATKINKDKCIWCTHHPIDKPENDVSI